MNTAHWRQQNLEHVRAYQRAYKQARSRGEPPPSNYRYRRGNDIWKALSDDSLYREEWNESLKALYHELGIHYVPLKQTRREKRYCVDCGKKLHSYPNRPVRRCQHCANEYKRINPHFLLDY